MLLVDVEMLVPKWICVSDFFVQAKTEIAHIHVTTQIILVINAVCEEIRKESCSESLYYKDHDFIGITSSNRHEFAANIACRPKKADLEFDGFFRQLWS